MKAHILLSMLFLSSTLPLFTQAQHTKNEELAKHITTSVANIKPGETILLEGGIDQIQLMEALAEQIHKKGAYPMLLLESERVAKARMSAVPEEHFALHHKAVHKLDNRADLTIYISSNIDYNAIEKQISQAYADKRRKVIQDVHNGQEEDQRTPKLVYVGIPTKADAEANEFRLYHV